MILLDVQMPGMDGFETAALIRQRARSRHTPIIFLTAFHGSETQVVRGYSLGAVDFLFKPIVPEILKAKVAAFVDLFEKTEEVKRQAAAAARGREARARARAGRAEATLGGRAPPRGEGAREADRPGAGAAGRRADAHRRRARAGASGAPREQGAGRGRQPGQERVPGQHEPRDPHADERDHRHDRAGPRHRADPRAARIPGDGQDLGRLAPDRHQRHPRLLQDRGGEARLDRIEFRLRESAGRHGQGPGGAGAPEGPGADLPRPPRRARPRWWATRRGCARSSSTWSATPSSSPSRARSSSASRRIGRDGGAIVLHFAVSDTGIGIPADKQQAVFDAFEQADTSTTRRYGGTGLGLAISSHLVEMMGGRIWVESEVGRGTVVHFTARFETPPTSATEPGPALGCDLPVLVVDDNATNRRILEEMLQAWGMRPTAVDGGRSALQILEPARAAGDPFPLVLLDRHMPEMDGFALAAQIASDPGLAGATVMMLSSGDHAGDAARCRELGVAASLLKPIKPSTSWPPSEQSLGLLSRDEPQRNDSARRAPVGRAWPARCASCSSRTTRQPEAGHRPAATARALGRGRRQRPGGARRGGTSTVRPDPHGRADARHGRPRGDRRHPRAGGGPRAGMSRSSP